MLYIIGEKRPFVLKKSTSGKPALVKKKSSFIQLRISHQSIKSRPECKDIYHSARPPFLLGGIESPTKFSKKGGGGDLTGRQLLEGVAEKERGDFFQGSCNFHIKDKLKYEIFNDNKSL